MGHNRMEWLLMAMDLFAFIFFFRGKGYVCMTFMLLIFIALP